MNTTTSHLKEIVMQGVFTACACISILAVALICIFLFANGLPTIFEIGPLKFLLGTTWKPGNNLYGILPMILGSIYVTAGAIIVGVPIGLLTAIYMSRFASPRINKVLLPAVQLLAGIPSVVYGFFGMIVMVPAVQAMVKSDFFKTVLHVKSGKGMSLFTASLLLGIMSALNFMASNGFIALDTNSFIYKIADLVSGTSFGILQILIGYSAAKAFGANPYLGAVVGGAFINSSLQSAYTVASEGVQTMVTVIPGVYSFEWVGYQGHVIPIVIACAILAFLEKRLHKIVPEMFDLFVTPLVSVFVTVLVTLVAVGPIFVWAENAILGLIQALLTLPFGIGSFIVGLFYAPTVVTGIHQMYTAIDLGQLAQYGVTYWLPIASAANIAQGGAALAVAFKTRDAKIKGLALPSALSAFMGITEPAIFGVNLRFFKPFIAGCIGGGCGALVCALTSLAASGTGVTGIFGILLCLAQPVQYAIMFAVAALVSFAVSFVLYKDEPKASEQA